MRGLLFGLVLATGCSYPEFGFVAEVGGGADATGEIVSTFDSAVEDSAVDTLGPDDTSVDGFVSDSADAPIDTAPVGCSGTHVFCDDFDTSSMPDSKWGSFFTAGGGTISLDTMVSHTAPDSFLAFVPTSGAAPEVAADLHKQFDGALSTTPMRLDFWVRVEASYDGAGMMIAKLQRGSSGRGVEVGLGSSGFYLAMLGAGGAYTSVDAKHAAPVGGFVHVRVEGMLVTDATGWAKLYIDDMGTPLVDKAGFSTTDTTSNSVKVIVGLYTNEMNPISYRARYDDVAFDWL
ncbi:MAG: hypothetical protein ACXWUG_08925 [Polyangiales bacterium]